MIFFTIFNFNLECNKNIIARINTNYKIEFNHIYQLT